MKALLLACLAARLAAAGPARAQSLEDAAARASSFKLKRKRPAARPAAKRLDLSGLLGPQPILSPDVPAVDTPQSRAVLAAVEALDGDGLALAKAEFGAVLERPGSAGGREGPGDDDFRRAAKVLRGMIRSGTIRCGATGTRGGSAGWALDPYTRADPFPGGEVDFTMPPASELAQSGPGDDRLGRVRSIDDWANGVLHETIHMYYSFFTRAEGFKAKPGLPAPPDCFGSTVFWNGERPAQFCPDAAACPYPSYAQKNGRACYKPCRDFTCLAWSFAANDASGATELLARELSVDLSNAGGGRALGRIVRAAR